MVRSYFILGLQFVWICVACSAVEPVASKRVQKCQEYSKNVFGDALPTCETSTSIIKEISSREFPHIAMFGYRSGDDASPLSWFCHGTLVSSRYVLTIGQCLQYPLPRFTLAKVRLGATETHYTDKSMSSDYDVEKIILHPLYERFSAYNYLGLIKLSRQVEFSENIRPICLPASDISADILYQVSYEGEDYNSWKPKPLKIYQHTLVTNTNCNVRFAALGLSPRIRDGITDQLMCSSKPENLSSEYTGLGESGAPWFINHPNVSCSHIQLGIYSFGPPVEMKEPDIAMKVFSFADWIDSVIWADDQDF